MCTDYGSAFSPTRSVLDAFLDFRVGKGQHRTAASKAPVVIVTITITARLSLCSAILESAHCTDAIPFTCSRSCYGEPDVLVIYRL